MKKLRSCLQKFGLLEYAIVVKSNIGVFFLKVKYCLSDVQIYRPFRPGGDYKS